MRSIYPDTCVLSYGTRAFVSLLGVTEAVMIVCLYLYVKRSEILAKYGSRKASTILCLPVYHLVWQYVLYGRYIYTYMHAYIQTLIDTYTDRYIIALMFDAVHYHVLRHNSSLSITIDIDICHMITIIHLPSFICI